MADLEADFTKTTQNKSELKLALLVFLDLVTRGCSDWSKKKNPSLPKKILILRHLAFISLGLLQKFRMKNREGQHGTQPGKS